MTDWTPHISTRAHWERKAREHDAPSPVLAKFGDVAHRWALEHAQREHTRHMREMLDNMALSMGPRVIYERDVELSFGPPFSFTEGDGADLKQYDDSDVIPLRFTPPTVRNDLTQRACVGWKTPGYDEVEALRDGVGHYEQGDDVRFVRSTISDDANLQFIDGRWVVVNAKEDTMAKRGASAKDRANAARRAKRADAKRLKDVLRPGGEMDQAQTAAEALAQPAPPAANPEAEAVGMLIAIHLLTCLGIGWSEIGELLGISSSAVADRAYSGGTIARRMGIDADKYAARNRIIRENMMGDFARNAAAAMQERIVVALPAFVRSCAEPPTRSYIDKMVRMVQSFRPEDVIARVPQPNGPTNTAGSIEGLRADGKSENRIYSTADERDKQLAQEAHNRFGDTEAPPRRY